MRLLSLFVTFALTTGWLTPAGANYEHCYRGDAPEGTLPVPPELKGKIFGLDYGLIPLLYRKTCGLTSEHDFSFVRALYGHVGCTRESTVGQEYERFVAMDISEMPRFEYLHAQRSQHPEYFAEICRQVRVLPWPVYDDNFEPLSPEIHQSLMRGLGRLEELKQAFRKSQQ